MAGKPKRGDLENNTSEEIDPAAANVAFVAGLVLAVADCNDTLLFVFLSDFFLRKQVTQATVGLIISLIAVGMLVMTPFMAWVVPKVGGPARTLFLGAIAFTLVRFVTACLPFLGEGPLFIGSSSALMFTTGCIYAFTEVGGLAWVLAAAPPGQKAGAMAALMAARSMGMILGPPLGGILFDFIGFSWTCFSGALLFLVPLGMFMSTFTAPVEEKQDYPRSRRSRNREHRR